jgi:hypothetical protein
MIVQARPTLKDLFPVYASPFVTLLALFLRQLALLPFPVTTPLN